MDQIAQKDRAKDALSTGKKETLKNMSKRKKRTSLTTFGSP